jgi:hypothetical protein
MTFTEVINKDSVKIIMKLILPVHTYQEHSIKTFLEGNTRWGYLVRPTFFAEIYFHDQYQGSLVQKEFADHINISYQDQLEALKTKALNYLKSHSSEDKYTMMMNNDHLKHLSA